MSAEQPNGHFSEVHPTALDALRSAGFGTLTPAEVTALIDECRRRCEEEGDARFCILHEMFARVTAWRDEHDEPGGVPAALLQDISERIGAQLPVVLSDTDAGSAARRAAALRDEVSRRLLGPQDQEWH